MDIKKFRTVSSQWLGVILSLFTIYCVWSVYFQVMEQVTIFFSLSFAMAF